MSRLIPLVPLASILPLLALSSCGDCRGPDRTSPDIAAAEEAESVRQQLFIKVFGDAARLDPRMVEKVGNDVHGKRHYVDVNGDGRPDEVWFIDTCLRHPEELRPVLVRVIDEDGDLEEGHEPDFDSDLYIVDWGADGTVDAVVDYTDRTGDNSVDEMLIYYPRDDDRLMIWWSEDIGNDNLLWYDVGYVYDQAACQYRTHFGGSEIFVAFTIGPDDDEWLPAWENPFCFYDHNGDGVTQEVIRYEGRGDVLHKVRYSFDADGDATWENPRDFDVSISARSREGLRFDDAEADRRVIRGIPTGRFLSYDAAPRFALERKWDEMMLCWVEDDLNIDGRRRADGTLVDAQERWEGVIAMGSEYFEQIGGPPVCAFNKRYEVATGSDNRIEVYFAPTDQRIHLYNAGYMWMYVDADYDLEPEHLYLYFDRSGDGFIDTWLLDANLDGSADDVWHAPEAPFSKIPYRWDAVNAVMKPILEQMPEALYALNQRLMDAVALESGPAGIPAGPWNVVLEGFGNTVLDIDVRRRLLSSRESLRYFLDVQKDLLILALKRSHDHPGFWERFNHERSRGNADGMRVLVEERFDLRAPLRTLQQTLAPIRAAYDTPKAGWAEGWIPHSIGWESDLCGYHADRGRFGFFGKTEPGLVMDLLNGDTSYHVEQEWGMDALRVGDTGGIGGVTLYVDGTAHPLWSPRDGGRIQWSTQLVSLTDDLVTVELLAEHAGSEEHPFTVHFRCSAFAGSRDTRIQVLVSEPTAQPGGRSLELGISIPRLSQEDYVLDTDAGIMASWGTQDHIIGYVGLGVLFPPEAFVRREDSATMRQIVARIEPGTHFTYHIQGDWLRGRRFPRCPNLVNWMQDLRRTSQAIADR